MPNYEDIFQPDDESRVNPGKNLVYLIAGILVLLVVVGLIWFVISGLGNQDQVILDTYKSRESGYWYEFPQSFIGNLSPTSSGLIYTAHIKVEIFPSPGIDLNDTLAEMGIQSEAFRNKMALIEQIIVDELDAQTVEEVKSASQKRTIREAIRHNINQILEKGRIGEVTMTLLVTHGLPLDKESGK